MSVGRAEPEPEMGDKLPDTWHSPAWPAPEQHISAARRTAMAVEDLLAEVRAPNNLDPTSAGVRAPNAAGPSLAAE
jgi:hypothetical protein